VSTKGASAKPGKQRKRHFNAPAHVVHKQFTVPVDGAFAKYPNIRRAAVRKGDRVEIDRGQGEKGGYTDKDTKVNEVQGKISRVDYKRHLVVVEDLKQRKRGNKVADRPVDPRNITILTFDTTDKRRKAKLDAMNARGEN
jgi:large subunit ribosomal protein L26e